MEAKEKEGKIPQVQLQALKQLRLWPSDVTLGNPFGSHSHVHMDAFSSASTWKVKQLPDYIQHVTTISLFLLK